MKRTTLFALFLFPSFLFAQECKVLVENLSDFYEGECKKGLANGHGKAEGDDTYEGQFKKGLPHGSGKYVWANGDYYEGNWRKGEKHGEGIQHIIISGKDSVLTGWWIDDEFIGEERVRQYTIDSRRMVDNIRITKIADGANIRFRFLQMGNRNPTLRGLYISSYGNGNINMNGADSMIQNPEFPMQLLVEYTSISTLGGNVQNARIEMTFNVPGVWQITFNNK